MDCLILAFTLILGTHQAVPPVFTLTIGYQQSVNQPELTEAAKLNIEVVKLHRAGKFDEALPLAKRVLALREQHLAADDEQIGSAAFNVGEIYLAKRQFAESGEFFLRTLAIYEKRFPESRKVALVLARLGIVYFNQSKYSDAEAALKRSLSIEEKLDSESIEMAQALRDLAEFYRYRRKLDKAEPLYDRGLQIMRKKLRPDDEMTKNLVENYSCLYYQEGREDQVKALARKYLPAKIDEAPESVLNGKALWLPKPPYTAQAKKAGASGVVVVSVTIDETGRVIEAHEICSPHPELAKASVAAAYLARFTPTKQNGHPVKVTGQLTYHFVAQ